MTVDFHPKSLLVTALFFVAFGSVLSVASDFKQGAAVGVLALLAYVFVEMLFAFNPAMWSSERRNR